MLCNCVVGTGASCFLISPVKIYLKCSNISKPIFTIGLSNLVFGHSGFSDRNRDRHLTSHQPEGGGNR